MKKFKGAQWGPEDRVEVRPPPGVLLPPLRLPLLGPHLPHQAVGQLPSPNSGGADHPLNYSLSHSGTWVSHPGPSTSKQAPFQDTQGTERPT